MRRLFVPALFLVACKTDGDLYGGGDGLTLTFEQPDGSDATLHFDGAEKSDLREVNGGIFDDETTWDPVALSAASGTWAVRVDDAFDAPQHFEAIGLDCEGAYGEWFTVYGDDTTFGIYAGLGMLGGDSIYLQVVGVFAEGDTATFLEGSGSAPAQWAGDLDACAHGDLAQTMSVTWSFDEDVSVPNQCLECNLPSIDLDLDFDINLTF